MCISCTYHFHVYVCVYANDVYIYIFTGVCTYIYIYISTYICIYMCKPVSLRHFVMSSNTTPMPMSSMQNVKDCKCKCRTVGRQVCTCVMWFRVSLCCDMWWYLSSAVSRYFALRSVVLNYIVLRHVTSCSVMLRHVMYVSKWLVGGMQVGRCYMHALLPKMKQRSETNGKIYPC